MQQMACSGHSPRCGTSAGFTLIEVVVTLVVMAVVASLALPSITPMDRDEATLAATVRSASDIAIRRSQWLTLRVAADGQWSLRGDLATDTAALGSGRMGRTVRAPLVIRLSPLGGCLTGDVSGEDPCAAVRSPAAPGSQR